MHLFNLLYQQGFSPPSMEKLGLNNMNLAVYFLVLYNSFSKCSEIVRSVQDDTLSTVNTAQAVAPVHRNFICIFTTCLRKQLATKVKLLFVSSSTQCIGHCTSTERYRTYLTTCTKGLCGLCF